MRASRLLSLVLLLQTRGRMTAADLAAELEVSPRTVYRDVEALSGAGIPVYADRGTGGGYRLLEGYRTRLTGLTGAEAESLFLAGLPQAAAELGLGAEMAVAHLKLLAALPDDLRERAERVRSRFHLDAVGWWRAAEDTPHLATIAAGVWRQRTADIAYRRFDGTAVERTVDPLGLVLKGGGWYFLARVHPRPGARTAARADVRTFRVSRLTAAALRADSFERPADFDLARRWREWSADFERSRHTLRTRVRLTERGVELVRALASPITAAGLDDRSPGADGWCEAELLVESVPVAVSQFAAYGPHIEVLEPAELRAELAAYLRAAADRYGA
ncbi:helix-turn-helix transcriptional regulator [Streptomonospora nanhaiensis]|uniref:Putative DNA-binding transcriptional regulator YafY n=1 Tax=Streptomonospora nanhaiensis TaxID=1323731 RepID=A0A853BHM1_9ACTN|nr:YafY family protein [Streptomonospora nanhaiensis]MBV2366365.1 YafY family transcriptional regulator [Streptomonospora nanhaiensis]NYI94121.1 putative DNA-binding transcriptional regulator YafY [Streptomonospora nanhaiensis]